MQADRSFRSIRRPRLDSGEFMGRLLFMHELLCHMSVPDDHPVHELEKPSEKYSAEEVVELQVEALSENNEPYEDAGIETAYNFASPSNRANTGPLESFKRMVKNDVYSNMIGHDTAAYTPMEKSGRRAVQEVTLVNDGAEATYEFVVSKQDDSKWEDCWMTDSVRKRR